MSAPKRPGGPGQDPNPKRSVGAADAARNTSGELSDEVIKLLRQCSSKQRNYIVQSKRMLAFWDDKYERIRPHIDLLHKKPQFTTDFDRLVTEQMNVYKNKLLRLENQEVLVQTNVEEMKEQEDKLDKALQDIAKYKNAVVQTDGRIEIISQHPDVSHDPEYRDAILKIPNLPSFDLPKLKETDLEELTWNCMSVDWSSFSIHWGIEHENAAVCRNLNDEVKLMERKMRDASLEHMSAQSRKDSLQMSDKYNETSKRIERANSRGELEHLIRKVFEKKATLKNLKTKEASLAASQSQREELFKKVQVEMNSVSLKCPICTESYTRGEPRCPKLFGTCYHTICAACMGNSRVGISFTCPYCQKRSIDISPNWALLDLLKEIPAQRQAPQ